MLSEFNLHKATLEDLALIVKLRTNFFQELGLLKSENCQLLSQRTKDYFSRKMQTNELHTWFVFNKTDIVAVGSLLINEMPPTLGCYGGGIEGYLFNIYTLFEYRNRCFVNIFFILFLLMLYGLNRLLPVRKLTGNNMAKHLLY